MAFDADKFKAAAKEAGYSEEDIQSEIDRQTKNINAATGQEFGKASESAVQSQAQDWRNQGSPVPGTNKPEDIRSLGQQLVDWTATSFGNAVLGGLGAAAVGLGLKDRMKRTEAPRVEPYVAPSYDFETTAREVPERPGLPQPSTPTGPTVAAAPEPTPPAPAPKAAPTGVPSVPPQFTVAGQPQSQMQYGATAYNQPTGTPSPLGAPPPAEAPTKPIDPVAQARIDAINAAEARKQAAFEAEQRRKDAAELRAQQAHEAKVAKQSATNLQKQQGKPPSDADMALVRKSEENKIDKANVAQKQAFAKQQAVISGTAGPAVTPPAAAPAATPVTPATPAPAPAATAQPSSFESTLGKPTVTTGSGMPAYVGEGGESAKMKKEFGSIKDVPKGYVFVPEGQYMDIMRNAVGQEAFTSKLGEFGGYPKTTEAAYEQSRAINKSLGRATREEAKAAGTALGDVTPSITKKVAGSKLVKVAGVGGALISLADVANAKEARQAIGEMLLPIGVTPSELQPGTLTAKQLKAFEESQKLGSPYRSVPPPR